MPDPPRQVFQEVAADKQRHNRDLSRRVAEPKQHLPPGPSVHRNADAGQQQAETQPAPRRGIQLDPAQLLTLLSQGHSDETQAAGRDPVLQLESTQHHQVQGSEVSNSAAAAARRNSSRPQPLA